MEQNGMETKQGIESAFSILQLLSEEQLQVEGPDEEGQYIIKAAAGEVPEQAREILGALESLDSLRVPAERLGKDLRKFLKERDLTGGGLLLLAGLRLFFIRQEGPDGYSILMDRRFQETVPQPEVRLEHLIAALRKLDGQKGLFRAPVQRVYRAVDIPGILLEGIRPAALSPQEVQGLSAEGRVFVLAGGLSREERSRAKDLIAAQGGRCASTLSGKTDYLAAGSAEALRENTLLQLQALQAKGREIRLLNTASLFALLGETPLPTPPEAASLPISGEFSTEASPDSLPIETSPEGLPISGGIPVETSPDGLPISGRIPAETSPDGLPISGELSEKPIPAILEEVSISAPDSLSKEAVPEAATAAESVSSNKAEPEESAPAIWEEATEPAASPSQLETAEPTAAEGLEAALEQGWKEAWNSTMESARQAEAQALKEASEQVARLQEARAAEERHLQGLGLLKFGERAAAKQELQRLNQALRSAESELARLRSGLERTAT